MGGRISSCPLPVTKMSLGCAILVEALQNVSEPNKRARPPVNQPEWRWSTCHQISTVVESISHTFNTTHLQSVQFSTLAVSSLRSRFSEVRQTRQVTRQRTCHHVSAAMQSVCSNHANSCSAAAVRSVLCSCSQFPPVTLKRAVAEKTPKPTHHWRSHRVKATKRKKESLAVE